MCMELQVLVGARGAKEEAFVVADAAQVVKNAHLALLDDLGGEDINMGDVVCVCVCVCGSVWGWV